MMEYLYKDEINIYTPYKTGKENFLYDKQLEIADVRWFIVRGLTKRYDWIKSLFKDDIPPRLSWQDGSYSVIDSINVIIYAHSRARAISSSEHLKEMIGLHFNKIYRDGHRFETLGTMDHKFSLYELNVIVGAA